MSDRSYGLFEPDALLPAQFYAAFRSGSAVRGEKRLMLAVLQDALDCFQKYAFSKDGQGRQLFSEADEWIACEDRDWYFSFENICETLDMNPDYLRRGVRQWKQSATRQTHVSMPDKVYGHAASAMVEAHQAAAVG
jgi:hypothetical protein